MSFKCPLCREEFESQEDLTQHFKDNYSTCGDFATKLLSDIRRTTQVDNLKTSLETSRNERTSL